MSMKTRDEKEKKRDLFTTIFWILVLVFLIVKIGDHTLRMTVRIRDHAAQFTWRTSLATDDFQNIGVIEHPSGDRQQFPCIGVGDAMPQCPKSTLSGSISQSSDPLHIIFDPDSKFISSFFCLHYAGYACTAHRYWPDGRCASCGRASPSPAPRCR